jgi:hypothetical protein
MSRIDIELAKSILRGQAATLNDLQDLAKRLKEDKSFGYARRILALARKDPDLLADDALNRALEIVTEVEDLRTTRNQETLGLAGAIHKRKRDSDGQNQHLERSLAYYYKGYEQGPANDCGYTGINAAFLLDLLAANDEKDAAAPGTVSSSATARRQLANDVFDRWYLRLGRIERESGNPAIRCSSHIIRRIRFDHDIGLLRRCAICALFIRRSDANGGRNIVKQFTGSRGTISTNTVLT